MVENKSVVTINASADRVWEVLTKPEHVKQWQYGSTLLTDWTVGSEIRFKTEWQGAVFEQWGKILEVVPRQLIRYSLFAPGPGRADLPENYFIMNYRLKENGGRVVLEIVQEDSRPDAAQEAQQGEENPVLKALKKLAES